MARKVRIGILGCANIARKYAIRAFQSIPNAEMVSIASRDPAKAAAFAAEFGIEALPSYEALLERDDIDAVYVPLPIGLHKEWVLKALRCGKHVLCEKSLAEDFGAAREMVEEAEKTGLVLYENFMCEFHPQHREVLALIEKGGIGELRVFQGYFGFPMMREDDFRYSRELGGGSLNDAGAYTVFMARKLFEEEPTAVFARLSMDDYKGVDMKGEALLEFPGEKTALLAFSFGSVYQNNYSLWGKSGLVRVKRAYSISPDATPDVELVKNENLKETLARLDIPAANQFELLFRDFCETVLHHSEEKKKIADRYETMLAQARVLEAIRMSSAEGRRVLVREIG